MVFHSLLLWRQYRLRSRKLSRRLITQIFAGRCRIIVIRRELPRTNGAGWSCDFPHSAFEDSPSRVLRDRNLHHLHGSLLSLRCLRYTATRHLLYVKRTIQEAYSSYQKFPFKMSPGMGCGYLATTLASVLRNPAEILACAAKIPPSLQPRLGLSVEQAGEERDGFLVLFFSLPLLCR